MWLPHRNAVIRHNCLRSPIRENEKCACRTIALPGSHDVFCLCLKTPCYVDCRKPPYNQLRYITIDSVDNHDTSHIKSDTTKGNQEKVAGRKKDSTTVTVPTETVTVPTETDTVPTDGDLENGTMAWMWDRFSVDDYCPKSEPRTVITKAVEAKPRVTVVEPFQMTLREEQARQKPQQAWEEVRVEPEKPPQFKANPVPKSSRRLVYNKMVQECEKQRKVLHEKRKKFLQAIQCPFSRQDGKTATTVATTEKSTKRIMMAHTEEKPTFRPAINHSVPDFRQLHHSFEEKLKHVRQKRQPTIPQPFSFEASVSGQKISTVEEPPKSSMKCQGDTQASAAHTRAMAARSPRPTKAAMLREEAVRKRLACAARREVNEKQKSDTRTMLQKEVGMWVAAHNWYTSTNEKRSQYFRREMRARSAEYQTQLAEMLDRVNRRPLMLNSLYQSGTPDDSALLLLEPCVIDEIFSLESRPNS